MPTLEFSINEAIYTALSQKANQLNQSLEDVVEAALATYLTSETTPGKPITLSPTTATRQAKIHAEAEAWRSLPELERQQYSDAFVAVHEGQVIDYDPDRLTLLRRARRNLGDVPVLITPGSGPHPREFQIHSPLF